MKNSSKNEWISWGKTILIALGLAFVIRTFLFAPYMVEGASMEPTLHNQEKIFVNKILSEKINRGDIVIIKGEEENYVKRVIGLPGDTIVMKNDQLFINGVLFEEPYLASNRKLAKQIGSHLTDNFGPLTVPKDKFFVMGDNRLNSRDSRNGLGNIAKEDIIGHSEFVVYPFNQIRNTR